MTRATPPTLADREIGRGVVARDHHLHEDSRSVGCRPDRDNGRSPTRRAHPPRYRDPLVERQRAFLGHLIREHQHGILITLALLNVSSARTAASSPVVRCLTHTPARAGTRAISASSSRCRPDDDCAAGIARTPAATARAMSGAVRRRLASRSRDACNCSGARFPAPSCSSRCSIWCRPGRCRYSWGARICAVLEQPWVRLPRQDYATVAARFRERFEDELQSILTTSSRELSHLEGSGQRHGAAPIVCPRGGRPIQVGTSFVGPAPVPEHTSATLPSGPILVSSACHARSTAGRKLMSSHPSRMPRAMTLMVIAVTVSSL